jgi:hypothetical protein
VEQLATRRPTLLSALSFEGFDPSEKLSCISEPLPPPAACSARLSVLSCKSHGHSVGEPCNFEGSDSVSGGTLPGWISVPANRARTNE